MPARGEREINQLLLKFVCCRFAFGFSGPPLFYFFSFCARGGGGGGGGGGSVWLGRLWPMCAWWAWCPRGPSGARGARGGRGPSRIGRNCLSHGWSVLWTLSVYFGG